MLDMFCLIVSLFSQAPHQLKHSIDCLIEVRTDVEILSVKLGEGEKEEKGKYFWSASAKQHIWRGNPTTEIQAKSSYFHLP